MKKIEWYGKSNFLKDSSGIDRRQTEFVWRIFPNPRGNSKILWKAYSVNLKNSKEESS